MIEAIASTEPEQLFSYNDFIAFNGLENSDEARRSFSAYLYEARCRIVERSGLSPEKIHNDGFRLPQVEVIPVTE